jgi:sugar-specific transcriptional regulator TrmB
METEALEGLGLTRNEAIIYITLLDLGKSHIGQISEKTRMHRRTIYDCLERLIDRGLVSFVLEGKTRFFIAVNPGKLKDMAEEKEAKIEQVLPKLLSIAKKSKEKTEVNVYSGKEGLKNVMEDLIKSKPKMWLSLTSAAKARQAFPIYLDQFHDRRVKEKIFLRIVFARNEGIMKRAKELKKTKLTEVRFTNFEYVMPISIWIYDDKTSFLLWDSETGIIIRNKETAESFRHYFELIWKLAKK